MDKICFVCKEKLDKDAAFSHPHVCKQCVASGIVYERTLHLRTCQWCKAEFSTVSSKPQKYCSNECYRAFLNSDQNPHRGVKQVKKSEVVPTVKSVSVTSQTRRSKENMSHEDRCAATLQDFRDVSILCAKLHISYGYYQQLKASGRLEEYIEQMNAS